MSWYQYEIFGNIIFDEALTFEAIQLMEEDLLQKIRDIFSEINAELVDFQPVADGVQIHFSLKTFLKKELEKACKAIQEVLQEHVRMRLLVLDRQFSDMIYFSLNNKAVRWSNIPIR